MSEEDFPEEETRYRPPDAADAEASLLGMMLAGDAEAVGTAVEAGLKAGDFYRGSHGKLYDAVVVLADAGEPTDLVVVVKALQERGELADLGMSRMEMAALVEEAGTPGSAGTYVRIVLESSRRRSIMAVGSRLIRLGETGVGSAADLVERAEGELLGLGTAAVERVSAGAQVAEALELAEAIHQGKVGLSGIPTGLDDLDVMLWGLQPGALILIAARPGEGKSAFVGTVARNVAVGAGGRVLFGSLEMTRQELGQRWLSGEARVPWQRLRAGRAREEEWPRLIAATDRLRSMPVELIAEDVTVAALRSRARRMLAKGGLALVVVDYLQLMRVPGTRENRTGEVAAISRSLKLLAMELEVPVMACSQMNRGSIMREDQRPVLSDLRESGSLEQDANVVLFLHQPENRSFVEAIVAKNRSGPTGSVPLSFRRHWTLFEGYTRVGIEPREG